MARSYWCGSHYLEWLLDRQDVMVHRIGDLKLLGSEEEYQKLMIFFADVIQAFGKNAEVRQQVIATATVYFKRFYSRHSLKAIDPWLMAPTCLFLASKVEEFGVLSHKNLLASCRNVVHSHYSAYFPDSYVYPFRPQDVLECEFILLEALDCSLIVFHPYRPLVQFCEELRPQLHELGDLLLERAWWIVNDSFRTDLCLHYPPYIVALGCLQTAFVLLANNTELLATASGAASLSTSAARHHAYFNPHSQTNSASVNPLSVADRWFGELNVDLDKVFEVTRHLLNLYELWRRFDETSEMPTLLLKKIPRPVVVVQPAHTSQSCTYATTNNSANPAPTTNATNASSAASQSSASCGAPPHTSQLIGGSSGGGGGGGGSSNLSDPRPPPLPPPHHHPSSQSSRPAGGPVRMHPQQSSQQLPQGMGNHMGMR